MAKGIFGVKNQICLGCNEGGTPDAWQDLSVFDGNASLENTSYNALLPPNLTRSQLAVGVKASQLCAGAGAAGRTIVGLAGAEHEILAVNAGQFGIGEEFHVIDLLPIQPRDPVPL